MIAFVMMFGAFISTALPIQAQAAGPEASFVNGNIKKLMSKLDANGKHFCKL